MPVLVIEGQRERTMVGLGDLLSAEPAKTFAATRLMPALLRKEQASMFGLILTAWLVKGRSGESLDLPPSRDPRRIEAVVVTVGDRERHELWVGAIERHPSEPPSIGPWEQSAALSGLLVEPLRRAICPQR